MKISAGIVTFNPEINRLRENLLSISSQVDRIVCFDNGSDNVKEIENLCYEVGNIIIIKNESNVGIAKALNRLLENAYANKDEWMLTLDQDSVAPSDMIEKYMLYVDDSKTGILTPCIEDRNTVNDLKTKKYTEHLTCVKKCITSASFMKVAIWKEIDGFDDKMFIDLVDFDYCIRMRKAGYQIIRVNDVKLLHQIGDTYIKKILGIPVRVTNHSAFRNYYYARNAIYMFKKHHNIRYPLMYISRFIKIVLYEQNKKEKVLAQCRGVRDGLFMKVEKR